ncbi:hypothetical protein PVAP13_9KG156700 [Panicum virgatum]|uniref:Uncharacterized protein n=1 Tax=Panicum virgatum TaxID=38727 RepID=A0A8T0NFY2_PANVG|nr:hypothetical protein PVAP13_9KG156700 [Panicum virgatum]
MGGPEPGTFAQDASRFAPGQQARQPPPPLPPYQLQGPQRTMMGAYGGQYSVGAAWPLQIRAAGMPAPRLAPVANQPHGHLMGQQVRHPPPPLPPYQLQAAGNAPLPGEFQFHHGQPLPGSAAGNAPLPGGFQFHHGQPLPGSAAGNATLPGGFQFHHGQPLPGSAAGERAAPRRVPIPSRPTPARSPEDDHGRRGRATANPRDPWPGRPAPRTGRQLPARPPDGTAATAGNHPVGQHDLHSLLCCRDPWPGRPAPRTGRQLPARPPDGTAATAGNHPVGQHGEAPGGDAAPLDHPVCNHQVRDDG